MPRYAASCLVFIGVALTSNIFFGGCNDVETTTPGETEPTPSYDFADVSVSVSPKVEPNATVDVKITLTNIGNVTWRPGDVTLLWSGDASWKDADLALVEEAAPGKPATFSGQITAPPQPGRHTVAWQPAHGTTLFAERITAKVVVTCDDGIFCNGAERFAGGKCNPGSPACDDKSDCTTDLCDEAKGLCSHELGDMCDACFSDCTPDCTNKVCGDDGCGGTCGTCAMTEGCASVMGKCQPANQPGSCESPLELLPANEPLIGVHKITGDTSAALHQAVPTCNSTSTAVELVYTFTLDKKLGIDARSYDYDTVLHIRKEDPNTPANECLDNTPAATVACSDDAAPPGEYGSRVAVALDPGKYYLIVDGFDSAQFGPFTLDVKFADDGCVPQCDGQYCGDDDKCGGDCGQCGAGFKCDAARCRPDPCVPQCDNRQCGDDGCGGTCGSCAKGELCVPADGQCKAFATCDHDLPTCDAACGADEFCGSDCACHNINDPIPDLIINGERTKNEILFEEIMVDANSCSVVENCVGGTGLRKVLRFSVEAVNQGQVTLTVPPPDQRPDLFQFSPCHGHYHFNGFATYSLLDKDNNEILKGRKQAYCMEDTTQVQQGPNVPCAKQYDCSNQGIQAGWSDLYGNALDCQWLDITDTPPGDYKIQISVNPNHAFEEISFDNNTATVDVTIP